MVFRLGARAMVPAPHVVLEAYWDLHGNTEQHLATLVETVWGGTTVGRPDSGHRGQWLHWA